MSKQKQGVESFLRTILTQTMENKLLWIPGGLFELQSKLEKINEKIKGLNLAEKVLMKQIQERVRLLALKEHKVDYISDKIKQDNLNLKKLRTRIKFLEKDKIRTKKRMHNYKTHNEKSYSVVFIGTNNYYKNKYKIDFIKEEVNKELECKIYIHYSSEFSSYPLAGCVIFAEEYPILYTLNILLQNKNRLSFDLNYKFNIDEELEKLIKSIW